MSDAVVRSAIDLGTGRPDVSAAAVKLVNLAHADQKLLRAARSVFIERLHERSDNFDATYGLRVVEEALRALRYPIERFNDLN